MQTSGLENNLRVSYFQYDFAKHGGATGDITVYGDGIPANAIICGGVIRVNAAVTSGGLATVAIKAATAEDILAATAKASLTLNALLATVPDFATVGDMVTLASAINSLTFTVGTDALTAGKITVALFWVLSA